jgi:hypothetical protein
MDDWEVQRDGVETRYKAYHVACKKKKMRSEAIKRKNEAKGGCGA